MESTKREPKYKYDPDYAPSGGGGGGKRRPRNRLSCAECRRLKLKCDRVWPCSSCTKRGCARICPDGTLQAKIRSKDTSVLLAKISELEKLGSEKDRLITSTVNGDLSPTELQHQFASLARPAPGDDIPPILASVAGHGPATDFMPAAFSCAELQQRQHQAQQQQHDRQAPIEDDPSISSLLDGIGTLNVGSDGRSRYLGMSAGSAYIDVDDTDSEDSTVDDSDLSPDSGSPPSTGALASSCLGSPPGPPVDLTELKALLPARQEANRLRGVYYSLVSFIYEPCTQDVFDDIVDEAYGDRRDTLCPTRLALLYTIFALSVLFDPALPAMSPDASKWYEAAERCLSASDYLTHPTMAAVQTLHLMGTFLLNSRVDGGEAFWPRLGLAMRLSQTMGLHRDGSNWGLEQPDLDQRRRTFHEVLSHDRLQALTLGRPYSLSEKHFDTTVPESEELGQHFAEQRVLAGEAGPVDEEHAAGFHLNKWRLSALVGQAVDHAFSVLPPAYSTIKILTDELRAFDAGLPDSLRCAAVPNMAPVSIFAKKEGGYSAHLTPNLKLTMQQHTLAVYSNQLLLFLHRRAFARALSEAAEPLQTTFAPSVVTVIQEAGTNLIAIARSAQDIYELSNRWWHLFLHAYDGAACMASLVIKNPSCVLAAGALEHLESAVGVFQTAAVHGPKAAELLARVLRLRDRAWASMANFQNGLPTPKHRRVGSTARQSQIVEDEATPMPTNRGDGQREEHVEGGGGEDREMVELPVELGASTRLTRRRTMTNRSRRTASISTTSGTDSARVQSGISSFSRSRGTSFTTTSSSDPAAGVGEQMPELLTAFRKIAPQWAAAAAAVSASAEPRTELAASSAWQTIFGESTTPVGSPTFAPITHHVPGPVSAQSFATFTEAFHPPMLPPASLGGYNSCFVSGSFQPQQPMLCGTPGASPRLYPIPASVGGSPSFGPVMSRTASGGEIHPPPLTLKPGSTMAVGGSGVAPMQGVQMQGAAEEGGGNRCGEETPPVDLLDTFLTWHAYEQPYESSSTATATTTQQTQ